MDNIEHQPPEILAPKSRNTQDNSSSAPKFISLPTDSSSRKLHLCQIELEIRQEQLQQLQIELKKAKERYVDFYDLAPVGYISLNQQGNIVTINLTGASLFSAERERLIGQRYASFVAPEDRNKWHCYFRSILTQDNASSCELKLLRIDDSQFYAQLDCLRISGDSGDPQARIVLTDISDRKNIEILLRASENNLRISHAIAGMGEYLLNIRSGQFKTSKLFDQLLGIDTTYEHTILGWEALLHPDDRAMMINYLKNDVIAQHMDFDHTFRIIRHNDQTERWVHGLGRLEFDTKNHPVTMHGTLQDITERIVTEEKMSHLAFYDALTQLPNRRLLDDRLDKVIVTSNRMSRYGAVIFIDLDNFKPLNDTHGHRAGDLLLVEVAHRLARCVREVDTVARFGGDEFVVVLSELNEDRAASVIQANNIAEKIRMALTDPYQITVNTENTSSINFNHHCTASIGVVVFNGKDNAVNILKWADRAMYQAKEAGRNQIIFLNNTLC